MSNIENNVEQPKKERDILSKERIREFIENRGIQTEDFCLIEKLASFPKNELIVGLHNMFNTHKERSGIELEGVIKFYKIRNEDDRAALYETALEFYKKYDWPASWNLVRVLEEK